MGTPNNQPDNQIGSGSKGDAPVYLVIEGAGYGNEPSLAELLRSVRRGWRIIAAVTAISVLSAVALIKTIDRKFEATIILSRVSIDPQLGLASNMRGFSVLAPNTNVRLQIILSPPERAADFSRFFVVMTSVKLAGRLIEKYDVTKVLFASQWDGEQGKWLPPSGPLASAKSAVRRFFGMPEWSPPGARRTAEYLQKMLRVSAIGSGNIRKVSFNHSDPKLAKQLLEWMYRETDFILRREAMEDTKTYISYIKSQLQTVTAPERQHSLVTLLSDKEANLMVLSINLPYVAQIDDGPSVSENPVSPRPTLILSLAGSGGVFLGLFLIYLIHATRRSLGRES